MALILYPAFTGLELGRVLRLRMTNAEAEILAKFERCNAEGSVDMANLVTHVGNVN